VPIGSYGVLGDGRTVALVARDGAIDWFPTSALDGHPTFAALLDPDRGGSITLAPAVPFEVQRRYVDGSNVLSSTFRTAEGTVRITDSLNTGRAGRLPWTELARRVEALEGSVPLRWQINPGSALGPAHPWAWTQDDSVLLTVAGQLLALRSEGMGSTVVDGGTVRGDVTVHAGERGLLALVATAGEPTFLPSCADIDARIDSSAADWQRWCAGIGYRGRWQDAVQRSALALKLLVHAPTGAVAGAGTTSLPEALGGERNFDYRFAWVRDASFAIDAFAELGLHEEVHAALSWLLRTVETTAPDVRVFYRLDGSVPDGDMQKLPVRGYRDSRPAVAGNSAETQTQLGCLGDLLEAVSRFVRHGAVLDRRTARLVTQLAERTCDIWSEPDAGIWELGDTEHYTISKISCAVALDRAARLAEAGQVPDAHVERWRHEQARIREWVDENCWSEQKRSYTFYAGTDELDASVLLASRSGYAAPDDTRFHDTVDAIGRELAEGPLLYRYTSARGQEACFLACSFWRVRALTHIGRRAEAAELMDELVSLATDLGLYSEEMTADSRQLRGNLPQALSHLSLITAATGLAESPEG
jgi:GH15 family glucan-1,4-alpha-glucosidase